MSKKLIRVLCCIMMFGTIGITGCATKVSKNEDGSKKINVYTSFYAMYDLTSKVGGDRIKLTNLVQAGMEPHDWEPKSKDMVELEKADVLIYNGAGMEGWIDKVIKSVKNKKLVTVNTSKDLKLLDNQDKDEDLEYDPHVWLNPLNAKKQMEAIKNALVSADPSNKEYYEKNYNENAKKLDDLDTEYKDVTSKFTQKNIVVAHQAFGYMCEPYGLKQVAIEGLQAEAEPTAAKMAEITRFVKENNVKYIFYEELISPKVAEAIAKETGAKTAVLNPLEGLSEDEIKSGKEYYSVMKENLEALKKAQQ